MLNFAGRSLKDSHIVCLYDDDKEYVYPTPAVDAIREVASAHRCHTRRAYKMLQRSSMELPVRGNRCKLWME